MITGLRIHWFAKLKEDPETHRHWTTFIAEGMREVNDRYTFFTREDPVGSLQIEPFRERDWPIFDIYLDSNELPADLRSGIRDEVGDAVTAVEDDLLTDVFGALTTQNVSRAILAVNKTVQAAIDTIQGHADDERDTRLWSSSLSTTAGHPSYSGPLYAYGVDDRDDDDNITALERKSPINAVWDDSVASRAQTVVNQMTTHNWTQSWVLNTSYDRYVILRDRNVGTITAHRQDDEVDDRRTLAGNALPEGYHLRAFEIGNMDDHRDVVGQLHWDPPAHGHITKDMRFAHSRRYCVNDWRNWNHAIETNHFGNAYKSHGSWADDFMSAGGAVGEIS